MKKSNLNRRFTRAFTLLELVTALAIAAITLVLALPSVRESIQNNQVLAQSNELISLLNFAKGEALRRNTGVPVALSSSDDGWEAIVEDPANEADIEGCVLGQLRCSSHTQVDLAADVALLTFNNRGYIRSADEPWAPETFFLEHSDCSGVNQRRRVDITPTGQISSCALPCGSQAVCPP